MRLSECGHVAPVHHLLGLCMVLRQRPDETEKGRLQPSYAGSWRHRTPTRMAIT